MKGFSHSVGRNGLMEAEEMADLRAMFAAVCPQNVRVLRPSNWSAWLTLALQGCLRRRARHSSLGSPSSAPHQISAHTNKGVAKLRIAGVLGAS